jgi:hypothetical protein
VKLRLYYFYTEPNCSYGSLSRNPYFLFHFHLLESELYLKTEN